MTLKITQEGWKVEKRMSPLKARIEKASSKWLAIEY